MHSDVTIVIQGPSNRTSIDAIAEYKKITPWVVVSCWDGDHIPQTPDSFSVVTSERFKSTIAKDKKMYCPEQDTFPYAVVTIRRGIQFSPTKYVVKTRSDERFGNLLPIIEKLKEDDSKLVYGNVFLSKWTKRKYHMGDHVFAAKKDMLLKAFDLLHDAHFGEWEPPNYFRTNIHCCAEQMIFKAWLMANGVHSSKIEFPHKDTMTKWGEVVDVNDMGPYIIRHNHNKRTWDSSKGDKI